MSGKLTRAALSRAVAGRLGLSLPAAGAHVAAVVELMADALGRGGGLSLRGFGRLVVRRRPARARRHPATGARLWVPAGAWVSFRPAAARGAASPPPPPPPARPA